MLSEEIVEKNSDAENKDTSPEINGEEMDMAQLLAEHEAAQEPSTERGGALFMAKVVSMDSEGVLVDIGEKSETFIPRGEFGGNVPFKVGESIPVVKLSNGSGGGPIRVSWRRAREQMDGNISSRHLSANFPSRQK